MNHRSLAAALTAAALTTALSAAAHGEAIEEDVAAVAVAITAGEVSLDDRIGESFRGNPLFAYEREVDDVALFATDEAIDGWWLRIAVRKAKGTLYEGQRLRRDDRYVLVGRIEIATTTPKPIELLEFRLQTRDEARQATERHLAGERDRHLSPEESRQADLAATLAEADASRRERRAQLEGSGAEEARRSEHERVLELAERSRREREAQADAELDGADRRRAEIERDLARAGTDVDAERRRLDELTAGRGRRAELESARIEDEQAQARRVADEAARRTELLVDDARELRTWKGPLAILSTTTSGGVECDWLIVARQPRGHEDPYGTCERLLECLAAVGRALDMERATARGQPGDEIVHRLDTVARWNAEAEAILELR